MRERESENARGGREKSEGGGGREGGRRRDPTLITNAQALIKTDNEDYDNNQET